MQLGELIAATDLSAPARHAVERAASVARQSGASLKLLHVANLETLDRLRQLVASAPSDLRELALRAAHEELAALATRVHERYGVMAGVEVVEGSRLPALIDSVERSAADLLVLGARGASFVRHFILGSTAQQMIAISPHPLLIVKQAVHAPYQRVLVPVDFSPASLIAVRAARAVAPSASLVLMHAFEVAFEGKLWFAGVEKDLIYEYRASARIDAMQRMDALCVDAQLDAKDVERVIVHGSAPRHILEQEQEYDCDLIAMGKHGTSMVKDFIVGSVTRRVLSESTADLLVVM
jgi:nucleotide-binding universal stress UspA family protein